MGVSTDHSHLARVASSDATRSTDTTHEAVDRMCGRTVTCQVDVLTALGTGAGEIEKRKMDFMIQQQRIQLEQQQQEYRRLSSPQVPV